MKRLYFALFVMATQITGCAQPTERSGQHAAETNQKIELPSVEPVELVSGQANGINGKKQH